jgi:hypothetical protein
LILKLKTRRYWATENYYFFVLLIGYLKYLRDPKINNGKPQGIPAKQNILYWEVELFDRYCEQRNFPEKKFSEGNKQKGKMRKGEFVLLVPAIELFQQNGRLLSKK